MNSSFKDGVQFAWDSSSLKVWQECPYKYYLKMIESWSPRGESAHLRFGSAYATALEHYHKHTATGIDPDTALRMIVREALESTWDRTKDDPDGKPWESSHHLKTRENLIRTIVWYFENYQNDPMATYITSEGRPAVEFSFSLPVDDDILLCGHIDRLVVYQDQLMVQDQKTTGSTIGPYYFRQYSPETQMSMYTFAGQMIYKAPVKGVVIDGVQIAVGFSRFERGMTFRTKAQLDEWYDDAMLHIEQARAATRERKFPMNTTSCGNYGGCAFRECCSVTPEVRGNFLQGNFDKVPAWDPLKRR